MPRFFVESKNILPDHIEINGEDVHHIRKVLRLKPGEELLACDGKGNDYFTRIESINEESVIVKIIGREKNKSEPELEITIFQGIPKSDKMDFIIQKSVELGVKEIVPVVTDRTVVRIGDGKEAGQKISRWQRISLEAAKQCNRGIIPKVSLPLSFDDALKTASIADLKLIPYENEEENYISRFINYQKQPKAAIFIGPEGGFSEDELIKAQNNGFKSVTLGPRILRTETAGIVVLSILFYQWEKDKMEGKN